MSKTKIILDTRAKKAICIYIVLYVTFVCCIFAILHAPIGNFLIPSEIKVEEGVKLKLRDGIVFAHAYGAIPTSIKNHFYENDGGIAIVSFELAPYSNSKSEKVCGIFKSNSNKIILEANYGGCRAIAHEFGHYVDKITKGAYTKRWGIIWAVEPVSEYGSKNPSEGFAEAFSEKYLNPKFKYSNTLANKYISELVHDFNKR